MAFENIPEKRILVFGDSNTYGSDSSTGGRYGREVRYPTRLQTLLGAEYTVIEEGLGGRTCVFDDPLLEGLSGIHYLMPCMLSHMPIDVLVIMLGTNDTKERFGCTAFSIARGMVRLVKKAISVEAWRTVPNILVLCPAPILPCYFTTTDGMGPGCDVKMAELPQKYAELLAGIPGVRFLDAGTIEGVENAPIDGMHLSADAHLKLATALAEILR